MWQLAEWLEGIRWREPALSVGGCARGQQPGQGKIIKAKETEPINIPGRLKRNTRWRGQRNKDPKFYDPREGPNKDGKTI